jgi:predicted nucleic acid-binding protein
MNAVFVDTGRWLLSFTDCTSIAVMRELKLTVVITTDRHFDQIGFDMRPAPKRQRARKARRS